MKLTLFLLSIFFSFLVFSQNRDSLSRVLENEKLSDMEYFNTFKSLYDLLEKDEKLSYIEIARKRFSNQSEYTGNLDFFQGLFYQWSNRDSALYYYEKALKKLDDKQAFTIGSIYNNSALLWYDYKDTALYLAEKSLEYRKIAGDSLQIAYGHMLIADIYDENGIYFKSIEHYLLSLDIYNFKRNYSAQLIAENNVAYVYGKIGQPEKEIEFVKNCIETIIRSGDSTRYAMAMVHLGDAYSKNEEHEKGIETIKSILPLVNGAGEKADAFSMLGKIYVKKKDYKNSLTYLKVAFAHYEEKNNKDKMMEMHLLFAENYNGLKEYEIANEEGLKAERIGIELDNHPLLKDIYRQLSISFHGLNQPNKAFEYLNKYIKMKEEYDKKENSRLTQEIAIKFEKEISDLKIQSLEYESDLKASQLRNEKTVSKSRKRVILFVTGGLILAILAIFLAIRGFIQKKKSNKIILGQKHEVEEKNQEIMDSIAYAKRIQNAILPPKRLVKEYLKNSFILYKPKDIVAGDFYWMEVVSRNDIQNQSLDGLSNHPDLVSSATPPLKGGEQNIVLFAAADCTGHGVPGAMVSVVCNNGLNRSVREHGLTDPGKILDKTREIVIREFEKSEEEVKDGMDIALVALAQCELESESEDLHTHTSHSLSFSGAHNPLWIINPNRKEWPSNVSIFKDGGGAEIRGDKQPIGKFREAKPFTTHTFDLIPGDTIYIFSDGYADQFGGDKEGGKKFKSTNFKKLLVSIYDQDMEMQRESIDKTFEDWRGDIEQIDDVCVIGLRV